ISQISNYIGEAVLCLDWEKEDNAAYGVNDKAWIKAFCDRVAQRIGVNPLVYLSASIRGYADGIGNYGRWIAQYANNNPTGYQAHPWNEGAYDCAIRQYSSCGAIAGYNGNVDLNKAYMDGPTWLKYANPESIVTPTPGAKTAEQIADEIIDGIYGWGNGDARKAKLKAAGYDPATVQAIVNQKLTPIVTKKSDDEIVAEVIAGKWGDGDTRVTALKNAGYDAAAIQQKVNEKQVPQPVATTTYTVQSGDALWSIARMYGTTWNTLAALNHLSNPNMIYPNQVLKVPGSAVPTTPAPTSGFHVGDIVVPTVLRDVHGNSLKQWDNAYTITAISGTNATLSARGQVWAVLPVSNIKKAGSSSASATAPKASSSQINVGDRVRVTNAVTYDGVPFKLWYNEYSVMELQGDRAVIGVNGQVTAAISIHNITKA
ncbi:MAG: LysM peptidoglycan-binding domain-containing protein, partial [Lactimicrobium massiliense]